MRNINCTFCFSDPSKGNAEVEPNRIIEAFDNWWLVLQRESKRSKTVQAAGMLILKRHAARASDCTAAEFSEIPAILHEASAALCRMVGADYTHQTRLGFNEGPEAGQTVGHTHIHILPVSASDPAQLKVRGGIGGAFESLRTLRLQEK
jgi:diadenosine tetraphosphate (Ap4A) HIT family hydrolase